MDTNLPDWKHALINREKAHLINDLYLPLIYFRATFSNKYHL